MVAAAVPTAITAVATLLFLRLLGTAAAQQLPHFQSVPAVPQEPPQQQQPQVVPNVPQQQQQQLLQAALPHQIPFLKDALHPDGTLLNICAL